MCEILVSHNCAVQHSGLLGCGTVLLDDLVPTCLWDCNASSSSSPRGFLKMKVLHSFEM